MRYCSFLIVLNQSFFHNCFAFFPYTDDVVIDDELIVVHINGMETEENTEAPANRKRSISNQPNEGSSTKKPRLSENEHEIVEL